MAVNEDTGALLNRSIVQAAGRAGFDPDGFRSGNPLQRHIFYSDPYVTCSWCNMLSFVDVVAMLGHKKLPKDIGSKLPPELLPPCKKCGRGDCFYVGSLDFTAEIRDRARSRRARAELELRSARVIMKAFRGYLRSMYGHARYYSSFAKARLFHKAATQINAIVRGRLARRRAQTERNLLVIKDAHSLLLEYALRFGAGRMRVFWYQREEEVEFVFRDYIGLCERMGFIPPRIVVERNIAELATRILARQRVLAILIQRLWRGVMARRIVKYFKREVIRLRQFSWGKVLKVQRLYRGHRARIRLRLVLLERFKENTLKSYLEDRKRERRNLDKSSASIQLMVAYRQERSIEKTARMSSRIAYSADFDDKKMKLFSESCYAGDSINQKISGTLALEYQSKLDEARQIEFENLRKDYIRYKVNETGPLGFGLRSSITATDARVVSGFRLGPDALSSRSKGYQLLFAAEMKNLMSRTVERVSHDFTKRGLYSRFQDYNSNRRIQFDNSMPSCQMQLPPIQDPFCAIHSSEEVSLPMKKQQTPLSAAKSSFKYREYKYPPGINTNSMDFLENADDIKMAAKRNSRKSTKL